MNNCKRFKKKLETIKEVVEGDSMLGKLTYTEISIILEYIFHQDRLPTEDELEVYLSYLKKSTH